jgi:hypothetical protein
MALSNAERQRRYQDRAREALRNAKAAGTDQQPTEVVAAPVTPLRLSRLPDEREGEWIEDMTEMEKAAQAATLAAGGLKVGGMGGVARWNADGLLALIEQNPAGFADYVRRVVNHKNTLLMQPKRKGKWK